jgi:hypothetical protein
MLKTSFCIAAWKREKYLIRPNTPETELPEPIDKLFRFARRNIRFVRASAFVLLYGAWVSVFRLVVLTLVTYFLTASAPAPTSAQGDLPQLPKFEEISDVFSANEITLMGICSLCFVFLIRAFNPLTSTTTSEIVTPERLERRFLPGFLHGSVLASGMVLAFLLSGLHQYIGFFFQFEDSWLSLISILVRMTALVLLVYCEEFLFRHKITKHLRGTRESTLASDLFVAAVTGFLFCLIKRMQFDLGWMQTLTLFLLSISLALRTFIDQDFGRGAGFLTALLVVFHPLLGLPIFGDEFAGVILIKPKADMENIARVFTGGLGGPLSSLALQLLLVLDILRGTLRYAEFSSERSRAAHLL